MPACPFCPLASPQYSTYKHSQHHHSTQLDLTQGDAFVDVRLYACVFVFLTYLTTDY